MTELQGFFPGIARAWDDPGFKVSLTPHEKVALCCLASLSADYAAMRWADMPPAARVKLIAGCRLAAVMAREVAIAMLWTGHERR